MPKVLISDSMSNVAQKIFEKNNITVDVKTGLSEEEIIKIIPEYDGMVVRSATKVTKNIIEAAKNMKALKRESVVSIVNKSINESLSRTIVTSLTTLFVVLTLYFFGGEVIHYFSFALIVGVLIGTYSSIFVASLIVVYMQPKT